MKLQTSHSLLLLATLFVGWSITISAQSNRPMTFMDVQEIRTVSAPVVSPDGQPTNATASANAVQEVGSSTRARFLRPPHRRSGPVERQPA